MNNINTLIFDLDGTLLDTLDDLTGSVNHAMETLGYEAHTKEEVRSYVGNGILRLIELALPKGKENPSFDEAFSLFKEHYGQHCNDMTKPYDGILPLIKELKKNGIKMAIVSNKADFAVKELAKIYFDGWIEVAIGEKESEGIRKKPAPDTVNMALKELGSTKEEACYVGDSEVDVRTANNADMRLIACSWGFREKEVLVAEGAETIIDHPQDILALI